MGWGRINSVLNHIANNLEGKQFTRFKMGSVNCRIGKEWKSDKQPTLGTLKGKEDKPAPMSVNLMTYKG